MKQTIVKCVSFSPLYYERFITTRYTNRKCRERRMRWKKRINPYETFSYVIVTCFRFRLTKLYVSLLKFLHRRLPTTIVHHAHTRINATHTWIKPKNCVYFGRFWLKTRFSSFDKKTKYIRNCVDYCIVSVFGRSQQNKSLQWIRKSHLNETIKNTKWRHTSYGSFSVCVWKNQFIFFAFFWLQTKQQSDLAFLSYAHFLLYYSVFWALWPWCAVAWPISPINDVHLWRRNVTAMWLNNTKWVVVFRSNRNV